MKESKKQIMGGIECVSCKKVGNNTVLYVRKDGTNVYRLHQTDIIEVRPDGSIMLNSGGWQTSTTRDRLNNTLRPVQFQVSQDKRVWTIHFKGQSFLFQDGMVLHPDGHVIGAGECPDKVLIKRIKEYAEGMAAALPLQQPNSGDCWGCLLREEGNDDPLSMPMGTDHLISHFGGTEDQPEPYFVPSLLARVLKARGAGQGWYWEFFQAPEGQEQISMHGDYNRKQCARWVYDYLYGILITKRPVR